jgi:hypothetical protein
MTKGNLHVNPLGRAIADGRISDNDVLELRYAGGWVRVLYNDGRLLPVDDTPEEYTFPGFDEQRLMRLDFTSWRYVADAEAALPQEEGRPPRHHRM